MLDTTPDEVPERLYHYTTGAGMLGITSNLCLWASDAELMNDSQEVQYGAAQFLNLIEDLLTLSPHRARLQALKDEVRRQFLDRSGKSLNPEHFYYVVSFCEKGDLLSMWRGYAPGDGYCIEFEREELHAGTSRTQRLLVELHRVRYGADATQMLQTEISRFIMDETINLRSFVWSLTGTFVLAKDPAFAEEKEYRLVARASACYGPRPEIRNAEKHLVTYRELNLSRESIRSIRVGPGPYQSLSALALTRQQIPDPSGRHHPAILTSTIPLRR